MKTLPITGEFPHDRNAVRSVMLAPDDPRFRETFMAVQQVLGDKLDLSGEHLLHSSLIRALLEAPSPTELKAQVAELTRSAYIAGLILVILFITYKFPSVLGGGSRGGYSLNKAVHSCVWIAKYDNWSYGDGKRFPPSDRTVKVAWKRHQSVAHLWAAIEWNKAMGWAPYRRELTPEHFQQTMQAARYFEQFATQTKLHDKGKKVRRSILDADAIWRVPDQFLPRMLEPSDAEFFRDSPIARALCAYEANKAKN